MLGEFLFIREQLSLECRILRRILAARSRAGKREGVQFAVLEFDQRLRRSARNLESRARQEEEIGRRIQGPERPVGIE